CARQRGIQYYDNGYIFDYW
nr:immunoglobulin heavy chain junction region [Macaca mulatta]